MRRKSPQPAAGLSVGAHEISGIFHRTASRSSGTAVAIVTACDVHKGGYVPSPLFNFLFLVALIVPAAMYIVGVIVLMLSLVVKHYRLTHVPALHIEAPAH